MSRTRTKHAGARGFEKLKDDWKWPKDHGDYLFPSSWSPICPRNKDVISDAIVKSRKTFQTTPDQGLVHPETIRSHSGRHRMVNDMKIAGVSMEVGMAFSRIKDKKNVFELWSPSGRSSGGCSREQSCFEENPQVPIWQVVDLST